jgi:hypothetical protein
MTETIKQTQPKQDVKAEEPKKKPEGALEDKQLDQVTGGSISQKCVTGVHIKEATITH